MKQQVVYIHGGEAYSSREAFLEHLKSVEIKDTHGVGERPVRWGDTLREELGGAFEVFTPAMPNKHCAHYDEWKIWFERHFEYLHDNVVLVGWSLGGSFLARYLIENDMPVQIKTLILLAAPFDYFVSEDSKEDGGGFYPPQSKVGELTAAADSVYLLHSKDDFVVPYEHALKYKEALPEAELVTFTDKNHFLVEELPELIDLLKELR